MKTLINAVPANDEPRLPVMLHSQASSRRRALASARMGKTIQQETAGAQTLDAEIQVARDAAADLRPACERVLDTVVDRLLKVLERQQKS